MGQEPGDATILALWLPVHIAQGKIDDPLEQPVKVNIITQFILIAPPEI
jgi:hypothetical protein